MEGRATGSATRTPAGSQPPDSGDPSLSTSMVGAWAVLTDARRAMAPVIVPGQLGAAESTDNSEAPAPAGLRAASRRAADWPSARVGDAMSRPVLTIDASETLWDAWQLLSISGLRHLAVVDDDRCIGIISDRNILSDVPVSQERMRTRQVSQLVSPRTSRAVVEEEPLAQVARIMSQHSLEAVPVIAGDSRLVGIVTGSDLVRWWAAEGS